VKGKAGRGTSLTVTRPVTLTRQEDITAKPDLNHRRE